METQLTNDDDFGDAGASFDFLDFQTQGDEQTQDFQGGEEDEVNYDEGVGMVQDTGGHGSAAMDFPNHGHALDGAGTGGGNDGSGADNDGVAANNAAVGSLDADALEDQGWMTSANEDGEFDYRVRKSNPILNLTLAISSKYQPTGDASAYMPFPNLTQTSSSYDDDDHYDDQLPTTPLG